MLQVVLHPLQKITGDNLKKITRPRQAVKNRRLFVGVNENGRRVGEYHPKATLSDAQVEEMRQVYELGGVGYRTLAKAYGCGVSTARDILTYRTRGRLPVKFRPS